jgi:cytochrome P450/glutathione S-transferase
MPYSPFYRHRPYRLITYGVSPYSEIARWFLDRRGVEYREESHVPMLHLMWVRTNDEFPGLLVPETLLVNAPQILSYWEAHSPAAEKLIGTDKDARTLIARFYLTTGIAARRWAYFYALQDRKVTLRCWQQGAPAWEKFASSLLFPVMRAIMSKGLQLTPTAPQEAMAEVEDCFAMIEKRLSDGRRYLMGDRLTAVDMAFAALMGPVILPEGYGGPLPTLDECSVEMRAGVLRLRATAAGRFVLRLYAQDRGAPARDGIAPAVGVGGYVKQLQNTITGSPSLLRAAFWLLRKIRPVLILGKTAVVTRYHDVIDVLKRDEVFTIAQINGARMDGAHAPFILGWDRSAQYDREVGILRRAVVPADLVALRALVTRHGEDAINAARGTGRIDLVGSLSRVVAMRTVAEFFGTPGPNEQTMMRWMRVLFYQLFLNRSNDVNVTQTAAIYADRLRDYLAALITERKKNLNSGSDDLLSRLLKMQSSPGDSLDDDGVRRNLSGLIVGAVDTTSAAVAQAMDQLLDRPDELVAACAAAKADDLDTVSKYVFEALRFNPQTAGLLRYCAGGAAIGEHFASAVPAQSTVILATLSAMFDPAAFEDPGAFRIDRTNAPYLHFGAGLHTCFGRAINMVQIPQIAAMLLKQPGLRRVGRARYDGPFPDRLIVEFTA